MPYEYKREVNRLTNVCQTLLQKLVIFESSARVGPKQVSDHINKYLGREVGFLALGW